MKVETPLECRPNDANVGRKYKIRQRSLLAFVGVRSCWNWDDSVVLVVFPSCVPIVGMSTKFPSLRLPKRQGRWRIDLESFSCI